MEQFSETYPEARAKFLAAASGLGAHVTSYRHDRVIGPEGEALYLDVASVGPQNARKVLVVGSGTHGIEGYSGSALQTHWLQRCDPKALPADTKVVFTHAHNPWGFAHALRFTEENVDLNRNFVDFTWPLPANPGYARVHRLIAKPFWNDKDVPEIFAALAEFRAEVGEQAYSDAFNGGQYTHADGLYYGGVREQWSNRAFRRALREHVSSARHAAMIDFHTGIGPADGHVFLCFHPQGGPAYERARSWWGERAVNRDGVTHKAVARYQGLLVDAFVGQLADTTQTTAVVVEFGTLPREQMQRASLAARWLWAQQPEDQTLRDGLMRDIREAFYPSDLAWRQRVLDQSVGIINAALAGVGASR